METVRQETETCAQPAATAIKPLVDKAVKHWHHVEPVLSAPTNDEEHERLVAILDALLDRGGADESHELAGLVDAIGKLVEAYEDEHPSVPQSSAVDAIRFLIEQHGLKQSDLPEIGNQSVVSQVLAGKRELNIKQVGRLAARFGVPADVFVD